MCQCAQLMAPGQSQTSHAKVTTCSDTLSNNNNFHAK